MLDIQCDDLM